MAGERKEGRGGDDRCGEGEGRNTTTSSRCLDQVTSGLFLSVIVGIYIISARFFSFRFVSEL